MYLKLLKNRLIFKLSLVQLLSYFGAWFSNVAIYTMILHFGVSPIINALVVSMYALPALLAPLSGSIVDKYLSKRFMIFLLLIELVMTSFYLMISDASQVWLLMVFIFIRTIASFAFFNAEMSMLPLVLSKEELKGANELHSIIWSTTFALGMALGGISVDLFGIYTTIKIDIALFVLAIIIFFSIKLDISKRSQDPLIKLIKEGFLYIKKNKNVRFFIILHAVVALTAFDTLINLLTDNYYKYVISIPLAIGWLNATRAIGLMVGPFFMSKRINQKTLSKYLIFQGLLIILWAVVQRDFYSSLALMFFIGFFTTTLWSYTYTLMQNSIEPIFMGRTLAYAEMIFMATSVGTTLFTGFAYSKGLDLPYITAILGIGFILMAFYYKSNDKIFS